MNENVHFYKCDWQWSQTLCAALPGILYLWRPIVLSSLEPGEVTDYYTNTSNGYTATDVDLFKSLIITSSYYVQKDVSILIKSRLFCNRKLFIIW